MSFSTESSYSSRGPSKVTPRRPEPQRVLARLRYDGDEVPVLIRLSELSYDGGSLGEQGDLHTGQAGPAANNLAAHVPPSAAGSPSAMDAHARAHEAASRVNPYAGPDEPILAYQNLNHPPSGQAITEDSLLRVGSAVEVTSQPPTPQAGLSQAHVPHPGITGQTDGAAPANVAASAASVALAGAVVAAAPAPTPPVPKVGEVASVSSHPAHVDETLPNEPIDSAVDEDDEEATAEEAVELGLPETSDQPKRSEKSGTKAARARRREVAERNSAERGPATIPFDRGKIILAGGLILVTALTYAVLQGTNSSKSRDGIDPTISVATDFDAAVASGEPATITEPEVELWPTRNAAQATTASERAPTPNWQPIEPSLAGPATDRGDDAEPDMVPTAPRAHSINLVNHGPGSGEEVGGWPDESDAGGAMTHTAEPSDCCPSGMNPVGGTADASGEAVDGWPDELGGIQGPANVNPYYQPQDGGYNYNPSAPLYDPNFRTGMREPVQIESDSATGDASAADGGSLQGTIEIPRARANHEPDGSRLY